MTEAERSVACYRSFTAYLKNILVARIATCDTFASLTIITDSGRNVVVY